MSDQSKLEDVIFPTVLMFKPKEFKLVPPEMIGEWEKAMRTEVGLATWRSGIMGTETFCNCGPNDWDDCDQI